MLSGLEPSASAKKRDETVKEKEPIGTTDLSQEASQDHSSKLQLRDEESIFWTMDFDGALGKEGYGIGVWIHSPMNQ